MFTLFYDTIVNCFKSHYYLIGIFLCAKFSLWPFKSFETLLLKYDMNFFTSDAFLSF